MKKKIFMIIAILVVLLILLIPTRINWKDGGSVSYKSIIYEITKIHQLAEDTDGVKPYIDGFEVKILGMTVYRKTNNGLDKIPDSLPQQTDIKPMVMIDGKLYVATGKESTATARCGVMDGEIKSSVEEHQKPTQNNQSNFGTGYGWQIGTQEGTIEICINGKWYVYATE